MTKIRAIIVDDEPLAQQVIVQYTKDIPSLEIVGSCNNAMEANTLLTNEEIDLMFLDVNMPRISGIDFLKNLTKPPMVILTTAYTDYALEAFELNILDYLKKPFAFDRFFKAIQKAEEQLALFNNQSENEVEDDFIFIKSNKKTIRVNFTDIYFIEGLGDYIKVHLQGQHLVTNLSMKKMEELLPSNDFFRIHKSFLIRLDKIEALVGNMVEINGQKIPVGNNFRQAFHEIIDKRIIK